MLQPHDEEWDDWKFVACNEKASAHNHMECTKYEIWGSFHFSGPRKYSFAHVFWPKKAKITPISISTGCGGSSPHIKKNIITR